MKISVKYIPSQTTGSRYRLCFLYREYEPTGYGMRSFIQEVEE